MDEPPLCGGGGAGLEDGVGDDIAELIVITTAEELLLDVDDRVVDVRLVEVIPPGLSRSDNAEVGQMGEPPGESFHDAVKSYWSDFDCLRMNGGKGLFEFSVGLFYPETSSRGD